MQNLSQNELNQIIKMRDQSRDELERIVKMRRIKNYEKMLKEQLIISLLKSKQSIAKLFNDNLVDDKISDTKRILNRLRDILPKKYRKEIKKKLCDVENKKNLSELEKEEINDYLTKLVRILNDKEKYLPYDREDFDYYGIRDIENLFDEANEEDYYKPILGKSSFKHSYKYYESRRDRDKKLSVKQYLNKIIHHLLDMINDHKPNNRRSKVWKIQISMHVNFISSRDARGTCTIYVWSNKESIMWGSDTDDIIRDLFESFLYNYQEELKIISGSNFVFKSVELMDYKLHKKSLKRGGSYIKSHKWLLYKRATINLKNEEDDGCLRDSIILRLNYNEIKRKELANIFKRIRYEDMDFSSQARDW